MKEQNQFAQCFPLPNNYNAPKMIHVKKDTANVFLHTYIYSNIQQCIETTDNTALQESMHLLLLWENNIANPEEKKVVKRDAS